MDGSRGLQQGDTAATGLEQAHPAANPGGYPTALGASDLHTITLLGKDLARDVMGEVGFGELAFWLVTQERPSPGQVRVFEAVLAALADHGFTPTAIATRLTYLSAPDSIQGALAAGLLGGGSRFLGVTEDSGAFLHEVVTAASPLSSVTPAGTRSRWRPCARSGRRVGSCPASGTRCTRRATRAPRG